MQIVNGNVMGYVCSVTFYLGSVYILILNHTITTFLSLSAVHSGYLLLARYMVTIFILFCSTILLYQPEAAGLVTFLASQ